MISSSAPMAGAAASAMITPLPMCAAAPRALPTIYQRKANNGSVVVGYDRRFLAEHFAAAAAEVLAGNGFQVFLTDGATPTPVICFSVGAKGALGAVNITASHNPPEDCGFKVRDELGGAIAPEGLAQIEAAIPPVQ